MGEIWFVFPNLGKFNSGTLEEDYSIDGKTQENMVLIL